MGRLQSCFVAMALFVCLVPLPLSAAEEELQFVPLFNGKDLAGWHPVNLAPGTFTVRDGVIHSTGAPTGFMRSAKQYENFVIELDWMHEKPAGNAGLFLFGHPLPAVGTPFARGIEIQILDDAYVDEKHRGIYTGHGDVFAIQGASMKPDRPHPMGWQRCLPSENRCNPAGQWNHYRVEARSGRVTLAVNGKVVSGGSECVPRKGYLCLESEGSPAQFKNIRIAELPSTNPPPDQCAPLDEGFRSLYTGVDLSGWRQPDAGKKGRWVASDWVLRYDGNSKADDKTLWSETEYGDFVLQLDWRVPEPAKPAGGTGPGPFRPQKRGGIQLRGLSTVVPLNYPNDEKAAGRWVRCVITLKGDRLTVESDGKIEVDGKQLPSIGPKGTIGLMGNFGEPIEFASVFVRGLK